VVSKAFQVLSDISLRSAFDSNPIGDPAQRNTGVSGRGGGGMHPGFANGGFPGEINPEDLFNMFFGGGGGGFGGQANGEPILCCLSGVLIRNSLHIRWAQRVPSAIPTTSDK